MTSLALLFLCWMLPASIDEILHKSNMAAFIVRLKPHSIVRLFEMFDALSEFFIQVDPKDVLANCF